MKALRAGLEAGWNEAAAMGGLNQQINELAGTVYLSNRVV
jgi:hypothetical protein